MAKRGSYKISDAERQRRSSAMKERNAERYANPPKPTPAAVQVRKIFDSLRERHGLPEREVPAKTKDSRSRDELQADILGALERLTVKEPWQAMHERWAHNAEHGIVSEYEQERKRREARQSPPEIDRGPRGTRGRVWNDFKDPETTLEPVQVALDVPVAAPRVTTDEEIGSTPADRAAAALNPKPSGGGWDRSVIP